MIFYLTDELVFPDPSLAEEDGCLAIDGDLSEDRLILAYQSGIFPWYIERGHILWYSPHQRFVIFPNKVKISKSMRQVINSNRFKITTNTAFKKVIRACANAKREGQEGTWLINKMQVAYHQLHLSGFAHSIEVWEQDQLVGGLYGVVIGKVFCGESMFSKKSNASKYALIWLCQQVEYELIDCQFHTEHLERMGAEMISRELFNAYLAH